MVGSRRIVAQCLRSMHSHKYRPRIPDLGEKIPGVLHHQFKVFRRKTVGQNNRLRKITRDNQSPEIRKRSQGDLLPLESFKLAVDLSCNCARKDLIRRQQDGSSHFVMFSLSQKISRSMSRISLSIGIDKDLAGSGDHVDADLAKDHFLGCRHIHISRTDNLVHPGD